MRISNNLLIGIFITVLITLNLYVIPKQRKVQLELGKNALWEIPRAINLALDYVFLSSNSLIQSSSEEAKFKLQSFDLETGEVMHSKVFSKEIGLANQVACIEDALYVVFATSAVYKLNAHTLEVIWRIDWKLEIYNWEAINIEQSKDLILISSFNPYWRFYTFIKQETGEVHYYKKQENEYIIKDAISNIFSPYKEHYWDAYYNFKRHKFVFDNISKEILFIEDDCLVDISDSLALMSFAYDQESYKSAHTRIRSTEPFITRETFLHLKHGISLSHQKEITQIQSSIQSVVFLFEKTEHSPLYKDVTVDYVLVKKDASEPDLHIHNIATTPQAYLSDDYFVALDASNSPQEHQKILIADLDNLSFKKSFYVPSEQKLLKLLCDHNQLYALIRKADRKTYWLAIPIAS